MADVSQWSTTAASNNSPSPNGAPEGMAPSGVNNVIRENMAAIAKWYSDSDGTLQSTGSSSAYVLTTNSTHAALADQPLMIFRANHASTGASTLNVDSLGAKSIKKYNDINLSAGDIESGQIVVVVYNATGDKYELISAPQSSEYFKGTDMASASPTVPTDGNYFDVTGTTTISAFVVSANRHFFLQFDGALQLTHNSTDLDLPAAGANITTAAGDVAEFFATATNDVQCVNYTRANGTSVVSGGDVVDDTSPQLGGALDCQGNDITAVGTIKLTEQADAESDTAGAGQIWVDTATPNRLMYSDDSGTDFGISPTFISGEQTVATDTALNVAHGLGAKPKEYTISLICKTGDANYSVNDEIMVNNISHNGSDQGYTSCCDATNVSIIQGEEIQAINKTGFDKSGLTPSNWRWIVRAWL